MSPRTWTDPRSGQDEVLDLEMLSPEQVASIVARSKTAWDWFRSQPHTTRAVALEALAGALEHNEDELVGLADKESALGEPRLRGEVARTAFQLRMFATALREGTILATERDEAIEGAPPAGRPELVRSYQALGPVAVFGASNFPFAFSVLGGDTASAIAAGCTVVVKEHSAQPRLGARTVEIAREALVAAGIPEDVVLSVRGTQAGADLVAAPDITAVGFTGSVSGGRFLFDIAVGRERPIPFYGELGSVNPVVVTKAAGAARPEEVARGFVDSMLLGAGQFCTKPSILLYPKGSPVVEMASEMLDGAEPMPLLTTRIADEFSKRVSEMASAPSTVLAGGASAGQPGSWVSPTLFEASIEEMKRSDSPLREECFGPSAVVVAYNSEAEALEFLKSGDGVLVGCIHAEEGDPQAASLADALALRAGRIVWNGWPTGVAVTRTQMHGGPYPAATMPGATSVGLHAVMRFVRPVVWQSFPGDLLG